MGAEIAGTGFSFWHNIIKHRPALRRMYNTWRTQERNLGWIGCRHHVFEVMLASVFTAAFGTSGWPEVGLFTRFQKHWSKVNNDVFITGSDRLFNNEVIRLREEMQLYYTDAIKTAAQRWLPRTVEPVSHLPWRNVGRPLQSSRCNTPCPLDGKGNLLPKDLDVPGSVSTYCCRKEGLTAISLFVSLIYGQYSRQSSSEWYQTSCTDWHISERRY